MLRSPSVKRTSVAPCCAPRLETCSTSSRVINERRPATGGCANVQYPHWSRHSLVKGMKTCKLMVIRECIQNLNALKSVFHHLLLTSRATSADHSGMKKSYLRGKGDKFVAAIPNVRGCIVQVQQILLIPNVGQMHEVLRANNWLAGGCLDRPIPAYGDQ